MGLSGKPSHDITWKVWTPNNFDGYTYNLSFCQPRLELLALLHPQSHPVGPKNRVRE